MQEIITVVSGLLAFIGFYWAFIETPDSTKPHNN